MLSQVSGKQNAQVLVHNRGSGEPDDGKENIFKLIFNGLPGSSAGKESGCNAGDPSSIPESGRSAGEG